MDTTDNATSFKIYGTTSNGKAVILGTISINHDFIQDNTSKLILEPAFDKIKNERVMCAEALRSAMV